MARKHNRNSIRLHNFDYSSPGLYFVTFSTKDREHLFGHITCNIMKLNDAGKIVRDEWLNSQKIRKEIVLHEFIIMPDHFHGIVEITGFPRRGDRPQCRGDRLKRRGDRPVAPTGPEPKSIGALIAGFKSTSTIRINQLNKTPGRKIWQRNYYDHIIRSVDEYYNLTEYIRRNPERY